MTDERDFPDSSEAISPHDSDSAVTPESVARDVAADEVAGPEELSETITVLDEAPSVLIQTDDSGESHLSEGDREFLAEQIIGESPLLPPREPVGARVAAFMGRRHGLLLGICTLLLWLVLTFRPPGEGHILRLGEKARDTIYAPSAATVLDRKLTEARRREAAAIIPTVYDGDPTALTRTLETLGDIATARREVLSQSPWLLPNEKESAETPKTPTARQRRSEAATSAQRTQAVQRLNARLDSPLPTSLAQRVLATPGDRWTLVESAAREAIRAAYEQNGTAQTVRSDYLADDLVLARRRIEAAIGWSSGLAPPEQDLALQLSTQLVRVPNFVANDTRTESAKEEARNRVPVAYSNIKAGAVLVEAGTQIDEDRWAMLQDLDLVAPRFDPVQMLARLALCILLVGFCAGYIGRFEHSLLDRPASLWLAAIVPVAFVIAFRFLLRVPQGDLLMAPLAATGAMLLTILLNARVGLAAAFLISALCGVMARADSSLFLATLLMSLIGVLAVSEINSRGALLRAAGYLALSGALLGGVLNSLREAGLEEIALMTMLGTIGGAGAIGVAYWLALVLERPFGITTHLRLLELSSPDEVIMRRMQAEAPGTYTHSLMVAQLAEAGAKEVGADPLLCRVGGLYHDIGKLRRPHCFVENQAGENVHDRLSPQMSALLIVAHVKDGVELGRALRLPQPVLDIIAQHHGTTLISYFYHRATQMAREKQEAREAKREEHNGYHAPPAEDVADDSPSVMLSETDEALFRYSGPKPQSREAAIVLLADTVEASSRALPNVTPERLMAHIKKMTEQRLQDGELSECELTLRDLLKIEQVFAHVLRGVLHHRIEYPDPSREESRDWTHHALSDPLTPERPVIAERNDTRAVREAVKTSDSWVKTTQGGGRAKGKVRAATVSALATHLQRAQHSQKTKTNEQNSQESSTQDTSKNGENSHGARGSIVERTGAQSLQNAGERSDALERNGHNGNSGAHGVESHSVESGGPKSSAAMPSTGAMRESDLADTASSNGTVNGNSNGNGAKTVEQARENRRRRAAG